jgi:hypothetical protein
MGPVLHCGVLSVSQCRHRRPSADAAETPPGCAAADTLEGGAAGAASFFFDGFLAGNACGAEMPDSAGEMAAMDAGDGGEAGVGGSTSNRDDQLPGAARERLLRAFAGTGASGGNIPGCAAEAAAAAAAAEAAAAGATGAGGRAGENPPEMSFSFSRSSAAKVSSPSPM